MEHGNMNLSYKEVYERLDSIRNLEFNWDEDEAMAMQPEVVDTVTSIIREVEKLNKSIFNLCPGPNSEILIEFKNERTGLDLEFVVYPESESKRFVYMLFDNKHYYKNITTRQEAFDTFHLDILKYYLDLIDKIWGYKETSFFYFVRRNLKITKLLLANGHAVNKKDSAGRNVLFFVTNIATFKFLLSKGADVNHRSNNGRTPLFQTNAKLDIATALINAGADVNAQNNDGLTVLHITNSIETVKLLISNGADINVRSVYGFTPLHSAVKRNRLDIIKLLLDNGADVYIKDTKGDTVLHSVKSIEVAKLLVTHDALINEKNNRYHRPLRYMKYSYPDIANFLISKGAIE